jgi:Tfp pilus assembly protein PilF
VEVGDRWISIDIELSDTRNSHVIWAMRRQAKPGDIHALRAEIAANIIAATELEIPQHEASTLDHMSTGSLDAWSALHVGIQHANQFSRHGNEVAGRMFELAMRQDPKLSRAYAGMAFVKFQNAFMRYSQDTGQEAAQARDFAERSLELQPKDPFGNFMMGRIHWLDHDPEASKPWFERSVLFCPNYTWGYYGSSWADTFTGERDSAMAKADRAIELSPIDPMRPGMTGIKMWVYLAREDYPSAVKWAEIAARTPWAHAGMAFFAAMSHQLNGDAAAANRWMAEVKRRNPDFELRHLMTVVPDSDAYFRGLVEKTARELGV